MMGVLQQSPRSFGAWLRRRRLELDLTQEDLARRVGCSTITLRKLEAEERRPSRQMAERLAELLQVPPDDRPSFLRFARGDPFAAGSFTAALTGSRAPDGAQPTLAPRNNLPHLVSSFVGRERELAEVRQLLVEGARLLTLTGPGGTGKTRLALEAVVTLSAAFPDGTWWVELAPLTDPGLIPQTVASVLGLKEEPDRLILATLTDHLRRKRALLILDNCEHLIQASARLAEAVLSACPQVCLLATSRELLGVAGERTFAVPPLQTPDPNQALSPERLRQYDAVRLFLDRVANTAPQFALTRDNAAAVAEVCRRLDGIPLALELAAARVRMMPTEQLAARLDDAFGLLTGGSRTALPRHQTLTALIDCSYDLLPPQEQTLLRRLAVFTGGWTLEAAEAVCRGDGLDSASVAERLGRLIDKSLVLVAERAGVARYCLLETIRQYALAKLEGSGEADDARWRHAEYYVALAEAGAPGSADRVQSTWLDGLELEHDNLRSALAWCRGAPGRLVLAFRLLGPLDRLWRTRGHVREAQGWYENFLESPGLVSYPKEHAWVRYGLGGLLALQGDFKAGQAYLADSVKLFRQLGDREGIAIALFCLGWMARERGDVAEARAWLEECLPLYQELKKQAGILAAILSLAETLIIDGQLEPAKAMLQDILGQAREQSDVEHFGWILNHLGHVAHLQGDYAEARRLHEASLPIFRQLGTLYLGLIEAHQGLGETCLAQGEGRTAASHFVEGLAMARDSGNRESLAWCLAGMAGAAALAEEPERAAWLWGAAEKLRLSLGVREAPCSHATHERLKAQAREQLGEPAFSAEWAAGEAATLSEAIEHALS